MYKFGVLENNNEQAFQYRNIWCTEDHGSWARLTVGPSDNHIDLVIELMSNMKPPYGILYVLNVPRGGNKRGRYQCGRPLDFDEARDFIVEYKDYFESDGRHHIWVMSVVSKELIVYDHHNVLFLYNMDEYAIPILSAKGLKESDVRFPVPHIHKYNVENDVYETSILSDYEWKWFPLQEEQDDY